MLSAPTAVQSVGATQLTASNEPESGGLGAAIWFGGLQTVAADATELVAMLRPGVTEIKLTAARRTLAAVVGRIRRA